MKKRNYTTILLAAFVLLTGCDQNNTPQGEGANGEIWYPEKSQPGIFKIPDALKVNNNPYAKQTYEGVKMIEDLIASYSNYFIAPKGTKNTSLTPALGYRYTYTKNDHTVEYMYGDFSSTHRVFELKIKREQLSIS
jgi:predicted small secreted protein